MIVIRFFHNYHSGNDVFHVLTPQCAQNCKKISPPKIILLIETTTSLNNALIVTIGSFWYCDKSYLIPLDQMIQWPHCYYWNNLFICSNSHYWIKDIFILILLFNKFDTIGTKWSSDAIRIDIIGSNYWYGW